MLNLAGLERSGSQLLVSELMIKPTRQRNARELRALAECLAQLDLRSIDDHVAALSVTLGAAYGLKAPDAIHLASAVDTGAERFVTNNRRDFDKGIVELEVVFVDDL